MIRIPADAFEQYVAMGSERSYRALGRILKVSKRAIAKCAKRENWAGRFAKIDEESRARSDQKLVETLSEMRIRHLRSLRAIHGRALEGLKNHPLTSAAESVMALDKAIRLERLIVGEPADGSSLEINAARELQRRTIHAELRAMLDSVPDAAGASAREADGRSNGGG